MNDQEVAPNQSRTIQSRRLTATLLREFREHFEEKFSELEQKMNLPNKTKKKGQRFHQLLPPAAQARHLGSQALKEGLDRTQLQLAQTQLGYRREMNKLFREQRAGQIGNRELGEPGLTQQLALLTRINGLISMWESQ